MNLISKCKTDSLFVAHACVSMWQLLLHADCFASLFIVDNLYFTAYQNTDGSFLAVGSHDNLIYIYNVTEGGQRYTRFGKCPVSKAFGSNTLRCQTVLWWFVVCNVL